MEERMRAPLLQYVRHGCQLDYSSFNDEEKTTIREVGVRNMYIQQRLYALLHALRGAGVSPTVLKGAHLIHSVYPFGLRPIEDIDLLLERDDLAKVDPILREMGYVDTAVSMDTWTHLTFSNKMTYINRSHPVIPIDIHFSLGPYPYLGRIDRQTLLANTETLETTDSRFNVFKLELLLLHLCLHLFQHHFEDWQVSGCDIAAVIRHEKDRLSWDTFVRLVNDARLSLPVRYSLRKAGELAALDMPGSVLESLRPAGSYQRWIFRSSQKQRTGFDRYFLQFLTTPGIRAKLQVAATIVYPGSAFLRRHYKGRYTGYLLHITKTAAKLATVVVRKK